MKKQNRVSQLFQKLSMNDLFRNQEVITHKKQKYYHFILFTEKKVSAKLPSVAKQYNPN
jgi:hypothetical protein